MAKHSKNNTASSVFSYAEYKKLEHYGTKKQRLGQESMRRFDACSLCLQRARDPVACSEGHLYCKECVYTDLLSQKKDIKRHQSKLEQVAKEEEEERERVRVAARERVLTDFEKSQLGLAGIQRKDTALEQAKNDSVQIGTKRKADFAFDQERIEELARDAESAALRQIEVEQAESRKAKLPDFWLPSLTPNAAPGPLKDIKLHTLCRASTPAHPLSLKNLVGVKFTPSPSPNTSTSTSDSTAEDIPYICPSCKKTLSNSSVIFLMKTCSHVVCKVCTETLVQPAKQCVVCDSSAKQKEIVELKREGTGFAAGGRAETSKTGVNFQG
jgi:nitric oxide synthase-interacting protein